LHCLQGIGSIRCRREKDAALKSRVAQCAVHLKTYIEIAGWIGAALILGAYALISSGKMQARQPPYHWMNILGSVGLIINGGWNGAWPSVGLNAVWFGIALYAWRRTRRAA
jgi:hypothetical protein